MGGSEEGMKEITANKITCPYCEHEFSDSWKYDNHYDDDDLVECGNCENSFRLEVEMVVRYTTKPASCKNHDFQLEREFLHYDKYDTCHSWIKIFECSECGDIKSEELTPTEEQMKGADKG
jgi:transcription elongation factor Elf1